LSRFNDLHRIGDRRCDKPGLRGAEAWLSAEAGADTDRRGGCDQHNDAQQPRSRPEFRHGTLTVLGAPPLGLVACSKQTLVPQFAAASRLSDFRRDRRDGRNPSGPFALVLARTGAAFCERFFQILSVNSETIGHQQALFQITLQDLLS
jgi:hypothetical protein